MVYTTASLYKLELLVRSKTTCNWYVDSLQCFCYVIWTEYVRISTLVISLAVVQPNLVAAQSLSLFVRKECKKMWPGVPDTFVGQLGDELSALSVVEGGVHAGVHVFSNRDTHIIYVTAKWLLASLFRDENILDHLQCSHLILDEIHERTRIGLEWQINRMVQNHAVHFLSVTW
jgi:hypothetical protein